MSRTTPAARFCLVGVLGLCACSPAPDSSPDAVARPSCDQLLGGPELSANSTEGQPGFDELLAALDLSQLPPHLDLGAASDLNRALVGYLLGKTYVQLNDGFAREETLAAGPLGKVVIGAFAVADPLGQKGADLTFLRRGLYRYYHCARGYPLTLEGFRNTVWDYQSVTGQIIPSVPKAGPRRLYVSPTRSIYVAETLLGDQVRETEIQITQVRPDGANDFLTYDDHGQQVRTSSSTSGNGSLRVAASPFACLSCHFDKTSKSFRAVVPN